jgi:hypothetical protein
LTFLSFSSRFSRLAALVALSAGGAPASVIHAGSAALKLTPGAGWYF